MHPLHVVFASWLFHTVTCQYHFQNFVVVSDLLPQSCYDMNKTYVEPQEPGDLPHCEDFPKKNKGICSEYHNPSGTYKKKEIINLPSCTNNGTFAAKQCKGERTTGRCFCFDAQGERLFGQQWWAQADNMTCACSRHKADMNSDDKTRVYFNSLHCNSVGNYEELQCDAISEQCWCVDELTGDLTAPVVPQAAMEKLPCYSSTDVGSQYLRQCENQKFAQKTIEYQLSLRGTTATFGDFLCDDDGSFGVYAITEGSAFCTWRDNSKISSYRSGDNMTTITCNCARDTKVFAQAGKSMTQKCDSEGNYQTFQTSGYCVDIDGYKKSPSDVADEKDCVNYVAYH